MLRLIESKDRLFYTTGERYRLPSITSVDTSDDYQMVREMLRPPRNVNTDYSVFKKSFSEKKSLKSAKIKHNRSLRKQGVNPKKVMNCDMVTLQKIWKGHFTDKKLVTGLRKNISKPPIVTFLSN